MSTSSTTNFSVSNDQNLTNLNVQKQAFTNITGVDRLKIMPADIVNSFVHNSIFGNNFITLTNATPTPVMDVFLNTSLTTFAFVVFYQVRASNGTDIQSRVGNINFVGVNKAGTITTAASTNSGPAAVSAGTLTVTSSATSTGTHAVLNITATSSLGGTVALNADIIVIAQSSERIDEVDMP